MTGFCRLGDILSSWRPVRFLSFTQTRSIVTQTSQAIHCHFTKAWKSRRVMNTPSGDRRAWDRSYAKTSVLQSLTVLGYWLSVRAVLSNRPWMSPSSLSSLHTKQDIHMFDMIRRKTDVSACLPDEIIYNHWGEQISPHIKWQLMENASLEARVRHVIDQLEHSTVEYILGSKRRNESLGTDFALPWPRVEYIVYNRVGYLKRDSVPLYLREVEYNRVRSLTVFARVTENIQIYPQYSGPSTGTRTTSGIQNH